MSGYAASARITRVAPHRASRHEPPRGSDGEWANVVELEGSVVEEISGRPILAPLTDALAPLTDVWDDVREIWRQSMDVLRDPRIY